MARELDYDDCNYKEETYDDDGNKIVYCNNTIDNDCIYKEKIRDRYGNDNIFICTLQ